MPRRPGRGDQTAPLLQQTSPADNATGVALNSNLVLTFNEAVKAGSGVINIYAANGTLFRSIAVNDTSQVTFSSNKVTINPGADFSLGASYYVQLVAGVIDDSAGNDYAGISSTTGFNFTTITRPLLKEGSEFLVNTTTYWQQNTPNVAALSDGRFVVVWHDSSNSADDPGGSVRAQIFDADGDKSGPEFLVNTSTTGIQGFPSVTGLSDGRFIVTWSDIPHQRVYAQVFDSDGEKVGAEFEVMPLAAGAEINSMVTTLADGRFVVTWAHNGAGGDGSPYGVVARIFEADGDPIGTSFVVNTTTLGNQELPVISALTGGGFVIAWTDVANSKACAQVYDQTGSTVGGEIIVAPGSPQDSPMVAGLADGGFVVLWKVLNQFSVSMYGQVFHADGTTSGAVFPVTSAATTEGGSPLHQVIGVLDDGRFVVAWESYDPVAQDTDIRAQIFNLDGTKSGDEFAVATTVVGHQGDPSLDVLSDGSVVIAWMDVSFSPDDPSETAVRAQIFSLEDSAPPPPPPADLTLTGNGLANTLTGDAGNDTITGLGQADRLTGAGGSDTFVYTAVLDSTSTTRDTIVDFNASADLLDLWFQVTGIDAAITVGSIGRRFDSDLASVVNASKLAAHHAVLFTPSGGSLAGDTLLVVDANGIAGYQARADLVILLGDSSSLGGLTTGDFV